MGISRTKLVSKGHLAPSTRVLFYYSDDKGSAFRDWAAQSFGDLKSRFERESKLPAINGGREKWAWFQTDAANTLVVSLGSSKRKDSQAIRFQTEKALREAYARAGDSIELAYYSFSNAELKVVAEASVVAGYQFQKLGSSEIEATPIEVQFTSSPLSEKELREAQIMGESTCYARELSNLPPNVANPKGFVEKVREWTRDLDLEIKVYGRKECQEMGMGCFVSVAAGSANEPQAMVMRYRPSGDGGSKTVLGVVGKGVTCDTGGYNLKIQDYKMLLDMKGDMGGAAASAASMIAIARLGAQIGVVGVVGLTDNMVSSTATHPGDVVKSLSGQTVEIQNTDAEGRLVLADMIALAKKEGATALVDLATLTGACLIAVGKYYSGIFSHSPEWQNKVESIANRNGELVWPLPLNYRFGDEIQSDVADLSNMGFSKDGGASIAANFLEKFVGDTPWVHLDIAGAQKYTPNRGHHGTANFSGVMASSMAHLALSME